MDEVRIPPAGDGFYATGKHSEEERLPKLEDCYRHELMDDKECQELRDRILLLRRSR